MNKFGLAKGSEGGLSDIHLPSMTQRIVPKVQIVPQEPEILQLDIDRKRSSAQYKVSSNSKIKHIIARGPAGANLTQSIQSEKVNIDLTRTEQSIE